MSLALIISTRELRRTAQVGILPSEIFKLSGTAELIVLMKFVIGNDRGFLFVLLPTPRKFIPPGTEI